MDIRNVYRNRKSSREKTGKSQIRSRVGQSTNSEKYPSGDNEGPTSIGGRGELDEPILQ